ncbi:MAG TPA: glycosyltransferase [Candidatus Dormibacteraeota bacterium]|nr:glycosyltransferase [Candidatus Dormibacteraeota bacterium]
MALPDVAVVVATRDRPDRLGRCLDALAEQERRPDEVVVVDDGSRPPVDSRPGALDRPGLRVRVLRRSSPSGPAAARNQGWRAASAPWIAFTDDDCRPAPGWISALLDGADPDGVRVGRTLPDPADGPRTSITDRTVRVERFDGGFHACNVAYPRALLERLGGFDEGFRRPFGEDTDLGQRALRAGAGAAFVPAAVVRHAVHRDGVIGLLRERRRLGDQARLARLHPELRRGLFAGPFAYGEHRALLASVAGLALLPVTPAGLAPLGRYAEMCRSRVLDLPPRRRALDLAGTVAIDLYEVAVCAAGSARHRSLLL